MRARSNHGLEVCRGQAKAERQPLCLETRCLVGTATPVSFDPLAQVPCAEPWTMRRSGLS